MNRVVITGVGSVTPYGIGVKALWDGIEAFTAAIGPISWLADESCSFRNGGAVHGYNVDKHFNAGQIMLLDRATQFALLAGREALGMAALGLSEEESERAAVYIGTATGGSESIHHGYKELYVLKSHTLPPLIVPRAMSNAAASQISLEHKLRGPALTISTACASSTQAIGEAFRLLRSGDIDVAVAGGTDACLNVFTWKAWEAIRAMAPDTCRPFSKGRRGMILGEGAGVVVLETRDRALKRSANILGELIGYAVNSDAQDIVKPSVAGASRAMRDALCYAGIAPHEVSYINAHGTGTTLNDRCETAAIHAVFGLHAQRLAVSSVKSSVGHLMGAAGAVELIAALMAYNRNILPPTMNYLGADPECNLDYVTEGARLQQTDVIVKNSFAFGGLNTSLVMRKHKDIAQ
jgi:nodulation protein E